VPFFQNGDGVVPGQKGRRKALRLLYCELNSLTESNKQKLQLVIESLSKRVVALNAVEGILGIIQNKCH